MKSWLRKIFPSTPKPDPDRPHSIDDILRTSGKACSVTLINVALATSESEFVEIVHCPSLIGSAIRDGDVISNQGYGRDLLSSQTYMFKSSDIASFVNGGKLEHSIFMLRKDNPSLFGSKYTSFTIGRAKDNDIRIIDVAISRYHARIALSRDGFSITDLRSQNGTRINGMPISELPHVLQDGDTVSIGRYEFRFLLPASLYKRLRSQSA